MIAATAILFVLSSLPFPVLFLPGGSFQSEEIRVAVPGVLTDMGKEL